MVILGKEGRFEEATLRQFSNVANTSDKAALMPDGHLGYGVPIGSVMANKDKVSPHGVGFDIGCGNTALKLDFTLKDFDNPLSHYADRIKGAISSGVGHANNLFRMQKFHQLDYTRYKDSFDEWAERARDYLNNIRDKFGDTWVKSKYTPFKDELLDLDEEKVNRLIKIAKGQLSSIGSGNHYLNLFEDDNGFVWLGCHFGSRGFGYNISNLFMRNMGLKDSMEAPVEYLDKEDGDLFNWYVDLTMIAQDYAKLGRSVALDAVKQILEVDEGKSIKVLETINNHHNAIWKEDIDGDEYLVVRKGSTPFFGKCFVGSTMIEPSYILSPTDKVSSDTCLNSTVHGAGRVLGRSMAMGKKDKQGNWKREPKVKQEDMNKRVTDAGIILIGGGVDEDFACYKRLDDILDNELDGLANVEYKLHPKIVMMA